MSLDGISSVAKVDELVICGKSKCIGSHRTAIWHSRHFDHADYRVRSLLHREEMLESIVLQHISRRDGCARLLR
jgi:hypothetical protein